jgi:hypothetical protein
MDRPQLPPVAVKESFTISEKTSLVGAVGALCIGGYKRGAADSKSRTVKIVAKC